MEVLVLIVIIVFAYSLLRSRNNDSSNPLKKSKSKKIPNSSNIPDEVLNGQFDKMVSDFASGELATSFQSSLLLKKGERLIFDIPGIQYCEERSVKVKGGYQGFSVRIMKGVSYRFGGFEAASEKKVVQIDYGNLILTNKRIVFSGESKSSDYSLSKIVTIDSLEDGVVINKSGKQKMEYYIGTNNVEIKMVVTPEPEKGDTWKEETIPYELRGEEVIKIIQTLIKE